MLYWDLIVFKKFVGEFFYRMNLYNNIFISFTYQLSRLKLDRKIVPWLRNNLAIQQVKKKNPKYCLLEKIINNLNKLLTSTKLTTILNL